MTEPASQWIEYAVVGGYLALLLAVGFAIRTFSSGESDYFRSGCRGTWWLVGSSAFMQLFSAWTFTGAAGAAFEAGWSVMIIFACNVICFFLVFLFLGPWFRQLRAITAPEIIRLRYGPATQQLYAWLQGALNLVQSAIWLWGLATFVAAVFDFTPVAEMVGMVDADGKPLEIQFVIVLTGLIAVIYSVSGGSWAVMATDFLQSLILVPMTVLVAFLCLHQIGGISGMVESIQSQGLSEQFALIKSPETLRQGVEEFRLGKYGLWWAVAVVIYKITAYSTLINAQKYFGVKDGKEARKAGLLACVLMLLGMSIWFIPPIVARLTMQDEVLAVDMSKPAEASYAMIAVKLLPAGMSGLMVVAMLAATMSSLDSGVNRNAAVFVRDIVPPLFRMSGLTQPGERRRYQLGQVVSAIFGVVVILIALYLSGVEGKGVFEWMLKVGAVVALPMALPMFLGLFVRRVPWWSAILSVVVTSVPSTIATLAQLGILEKLSRSLGFYTTEGVLGRIIHEWSYSQTIFVNTTIGVGTFLATMPFWKTASSGYRDQVREFFTRMHTPVDFEKEVGEGNDLAQLRLIGVFAIAAGLFICAIMLLPGHTAGDLLAIGFVGGSVAGTGGLMRCLGRIRPSSSRAIRSNGDPS